MPVYEDNAAPTVPATSGAGPVSTAGAPSAVSTVGPRHAAPGVLNRGAGAGLASIGFLTLLLGAWAGIVPFVGPLFGFSATGTGAWVWGREQALLWLTPGAVAVVLGVLMMSRAPLARVGLSKLGPMWAGFLVACCGAWLAIGPFAWNVLEGHQPIRHAGPFHELAYWIGYALGPGVVLGVLGGAAIGIAMVTRRTVSTGAVGVETSRQSSLAA
ncbi:MAG: hypothetical protein ACYCSF_13625 [Acidimicrobiales bacterium]